MAQEGALAEGDCVVLNILEGLHARHPKLQGLEKPEAMSALLKDVAAKAISTGGDVMASFGLICMEHGVHPIGPSKQKDANERKPEISNTLAGACIDMANDLAPKPVFAL
jgi:hypothetical protein